MRIQLPRRRRRDAHRETAPQSRLPRDPRRAKRSREDHLQPPATGYADRLRPLRSAHDTALGLSIGALARSGTHDFRGLALTCLVAADRYHHIDTVITPHVDAGHIVVCDRYVPTAYVLDRLDGASEEFITNLYRHARLADLAIFVMDDPERCLRRARQRGLYSRFHHDDLAGAQREHDLFVEAAERVRAGGTPTLVHHVGDDDAPAVAGALVERIAVAIAVHRRVVPPSEVTP